jgi:hypothetical protein
MNKKLLFSKTNTLFEVYFTMELLHLEKEYKKFLNVFESNKKTLSKLDTSLVNNILKWREKIIKNLKGDNR